MKKQQQPYEKLILVCANERPPGDRKCCAGGGSLDIREQLKAAIKEMGLNARVRVSQSGCLNRCNDGPNVMVFPEGVWYSGVTLEDVPVLVADLTRGLVDGG